MEKNKNELQMITMRVPVHILAALDRFAKAHGISRTAAVLVMIAPQLKDYVEEDD